MILRIFSKIKVGKINYTHVSPAEGGGVPLSLLSQIRSLNVDYLSAIISDLMMLLGGCTKKKCRDFEHIPDHCTKDADCVPGGDYFDKYGFDTVHRLVNSHTLTHSLTPLISI